MAGCQALIAADCRQGKPMRLRACGLKAVVKVPDGMDLKPGTWFCSVHAPVKLLPHGVKK